MHERYLRNLGSEGDKRTRFMVNQIEEFGVLLVFVVSRGRWEKWS
jgi:hypothetical protein